MIFHTLRSTMGHRMTRISATAMPNVWSISRIVRISSSTIAPTHRLCPAMCMGRMIISIQLPATSFRAWSSDCTTSYSRIQICRRSKRCSMYSARVNRCDNSFIRTIWPNWLFGYYGTTIAMNQLFCPVSIKKIESNYERILCGFLIFFTVDEKDEVSIEQVARAIANAFEFKGKIEFDTTKADGQYKKTASNKKLRNLHPEFQFTDFDEAIRHSVKWYLDNLNIVRHWELYYNACISGSDLALLSSNSHFVVCFELFVIVYYKLLLFSCDVNILEN